LEPAQRRVSRELGPVSHRLLALPPSDEFAQLRALRWALAAPLPPDEPVLAQRRDEQVPPAKPLRGALLREKPREQRAPQVEPGRPEQERARQASLLQPVAARAGRRASVWPSAQTWRLQPPLLHRRVP
jgi:hypothetical protein